MKNVKSPIRNPVIEYEITSIANDPLFLNMKPISPNGTDIMIMKSEYLVYISASLIS